MARIPTPVERGAPVGSVAVNRAPTDYLRVNAPIEAFGSEQARTMQRLGVGLTKGSDDLMGALREDDKSKQLQLEADIKMFTAKEQSYLDTLSGQERLDYTKQGRSGAGIEQDFEEGLATLRSKYDFNLAESDASTNIYLQNVGTQNRSFVDAKALEADKVVKKNASITALTGYITEAVSAAQSPDPAIQQAGLNKALANSERLTRDPDVGPAKQDGITDPAQIDLLVRKNKLQVITAIAEDRLSQGEYKQAIDLVDSARSIGEGLPEYTKLQAKTLAYEQKVQGKQEYAALVASSTAANGGTRPPLAVLQQQIAAENDPLLRGRLLDEFSIQSSAETAAINEAVKKQGVAFTQALVAQAQGGPPVNLGLYTEYVAKHPEIAVTYLEKVQNLRGMAAGQTAQGEHERRGGGSVDTAGLPRALETLAKQDAQAYIALVEQGSIRQNLSAETWAAVQNDARDKKLALDKRRAQEQGSLTSVVKIMQGLGLSRSAAVARYNASPHAFEEAYNDVVSRALDSDQKIDPAELRRAMAEQLIKVRTDKGIISATDDYTRLSLLSGVELEPDFSPYSAALQDTGNNTDYVARLFSVPEERVVAAREAVEGAGRVFTLREMAQQLGRDGEQVLLPDIRKADREAEEIDNLSTSSGLPPGMVTWMLKQTVGGVVNPTNAAALISQIEAKGGVEVSDGAGGTTLRSTQEIMRAWLRDAAQGAQ